MTDQLSHPDHPSTNIVLKVSIGMYEKTGTFESTAWTKVTRELEAPMSARDGFAKLNSLIVRCMEELDMEFRGAADVAAVNRADQVKMLTTIPITTEEG